MERKTASLLGALAGVAALGGAGGAQAAPNGHVSLAAASYADLLAPVPNALDALRAHNAQLAAQAAASGPALVRVDDHHHHHHHHDYYAPPPPPREYYPPPPPEYYPPPPPVYHHHHHNGAVIMLPGIGIGIN
ncbi:hypothetical protein [Acidocella sp.]|uniref:hypothetical protein n=1 Tax=Acidocella sp. TaxID=50710 RepID=UPI002619F83B|nr:hypothetical protein [Acidocella sp.]